MIDQAFRALALFCTSVPTDFNPDFLYYWTPDGDSLGIPNPIGSSYKVTSIQELKHFRLLPLLILPRLHSESKMLQLLFKLHPRWKVVFPSFEIPRFPHDINEIRTEVDKQARRIFRFGSVTQTIPAGGLLSFKKSPTNSEENIYCFPFFIVRGTVSDDDLLQYAKIGWELKYLSKADLESDGRIFQNPNGDVYRAVERIHSGWHSIVADAYEYDFVLSFAGEQRDLAEDLLQEIRAADRNVTAFYDRERNLLGKDLGTLLYSVCSVGSRFFIPIISKQYKEKMWTRHELRAALTRAVEERGYEYILPLHYDDTRLDNIPKTLGFETITTSNLKYVAQQIVQRLKVA